MIRKGTANKQCQLYDMIYIEGLLYRYSIRVHSPEPLTIDTTRYNKIMLSPYNIINSGAYIQYEKDTVQYVVHKRLSHAE